MIIYRSDDGGDGGGIAFQSIAIAFTLTWSGKLHCQQIENHLFGFYGVFILSFGFPCFFSVFLHIYRYRTTIWDWGACTRALTQHTTIQNGNTYGKNA